MPVSPQDFALWSDLTGNPYPQSASERMALAPEVYNFTRNIGRRQGPGPIRRAFDVIGKTALAAGAIAGAAYLAKGFGSLDLDDEADIGALAVPQGIIPASVTDITPPTTSDRYGQDVVPHQTTAMRLLRGTSPAKPTVVDSEEKPATQSHVISSSQYFGPGSEVEQLAAKEVPYSPVVDPVDALAQQKSAAIAQAVLEAKAKSSQQIKQDRLAGFGDMGGSPDEYGTLDLYLQHQQASHQRNVSERVQRFLGGADEPDSSSLLGQRSVRGAEAFRQTPAYATMMRGAGSSMEPEELVGGSQPAVFTEVRPTPVTRVVTEKPSAPVETRQAAAPVVVTKIESPSAPARRSPESDEESALAAKAFGLLPKSQRDALLSGSGEASPVVTRQPESVRVGTPAKIRANKFLSSMSAEQGPVTKYDIEPERSKAVGAISFYPGGEMGVEMRTKRGPQEYVYATSDPYRMTMGDYAEEGFPSGMGSIGVIAAPKGSAQKMGLQQVVTPGGVPKGGNFIEEPFMSKDTIALKKAMEARAARRQVMSEI